MSSACQVSGSSPAVTLSSVARHDGELVREVFVVRAPARRCRSAARHADRLEDEPALQETGGVWRLGRRGRTRQRRRRRAGRWWQRRQRAGERSGDHLRTRARRARVQPTSRVTSRSGRLQQPSLPIARRVEPRERRHAAADGRQRERLRRIRQRLRHHAIRAVGELVDTPQLFGPPVNAGSTTSSPSAVAASARSVPAMVILKYGDPG